MGTDPRNERLPDVTRRQALAGLGGLGALGAIGARGLAAQDEDGPSVDLEALKWKAQRRRKFARPFDYVPPNDEEFEDVPEQLLYEEPFYTVDEVSSLNYLGVRWDEFGNPASGAEMEGAWQHTFLLSNFGMAQQMRDENHTMDQGGATITQNYPISYKPMEDYVTVPTLKVSTVDGEGDAVAISPLRDANRFGIINPGTFEDQFGETPEGGTAFRDFADRIAKNRNEYRPDMGALRYAMAVDEESREDIAALVSIGDTLLSLSKKIAKRHPLAAALITGAEVASDLYDVFAGVQELTDDPLEPDPDHVGFFEGFEQSYPGDDFYAGPYCGEFVTFHVYVAPGETGEVEVTSEFRHDVASAARPGDNVSTENWPAYESSVAWQVELPELGHPDETDLAPADKYGARIVDQVEEKASTDDEFQFDDDADTATLQEYERSKDPNPSIYPDPSNPQVVSDGDVLAFDAYDTTVVDGNVDSYQWRVYYTSEPDEHADEYVDLIKEETYDDGFGSTFEFTVDVPDDATFTDVHLVELEAESYNPSQDERRTGRAEHRFGTTDIGEPSFTVDAPEEAVETGNATFTAQVSSTPTAVSSVEWEVTDYGYYRPSSAPNVTETGEEFTYTPPEPGTYTIEATVIDAVGPRATESIDLTVQELDASATITSPDVETLKAGESNEFVVDHDGVPNADADAITWEFGDLETRTRESTSYTVPKESDVDALEVSVVVPSVTHDVEARATREYSIVRDDDMTVTLDAPDVIVSGNRTQVEADASGYETDTVTYEFGEHVDKGVVAPHQDHGYVEFSTSEVVTRTLSVTAYEDGDNRESASDETEVEVRPFDVTIEGPTSPKENELVSYDAALEGEVDDPTYEWNVFDSGSTVSGRFDDPGDRTVRVDVTDDGTTISAQLDVGVRSDHDLSVTLDAPDRMRRDDEVTVSADVSGAEADVRYSWTNADTPTGSQGTADSATVDPNSTGELEVGVTATEEADNLESDEATATIDVLPPEPFEVTLDGPSRAKASTSETYEADVSGAASPVEFDWNVSASDDHATVDFGSCGTREIEVEATETGLYDRTDDDSITVDVYDCDMSVSLQDLPNEMYDDEETQVSADVDGAESDVRYQWTNADPPTGTHGTADDATVDPSSTGDLEVGVRATEESDNGESATDSETVTVVSRPEPEIDGIDHSTCAGCSDHDFEANVTNAHLIDRYVWYLNGSQTDTGSQTTVSPPDGSHTMKLEIEVDGDVVDSQRRDFSAYSSY